MQQPFEIYSTKTCAYCTRAKRELANRGYSYVEKYIDNSPEYKKELFERLPTAKTVPQIFYADKLIGGYDDLVRYLENEHN